MYKTKISGIYSIKCLANNKIYIGQSTHIKARFNTHKHCLNHNKHANEKLQYSWNKYGIDEFKFSIVEECNKEQMEEREQYYIELYNSNNEENGFNCTSGGVHTVINKDICKKVSASLMVSKNTNRGA